MRVQPASSHPGALLAQQWATKGARASLAGEPQADPDDPVSLQQHGDHELDTTFSQETLLALVQGILQCVSGQNLMVDSEWQPVSQYYAKPGAPAWLSAAHVALNNPLNAFVLRLDACGELTAPGSIPTPFQLDMQLLHFAWPLPGLPLQGQFELGSRAGIYHGATVYFTLTQHVPTPAGEAGVPDRAEPRGTGLGSGLLLAQLALGHNPEIQRIVTRLLPAHVKVPCLQPHDGCYVTQEDNTGSDNHLDINA